MANSNLIFRRNLFVIAIFLLSACGSSNSPPPPPPPPVNQAPIPVITASAMSVDEKQSFESFLGFHSPQLAA